MSPTILAQRKRNDQFLTLLSHSERTIRSTSRLSWVSFNLYELPTVVRGCLYTHPCTTPSGDGGIERSTPSPHESNQILSQCSYYEREHVINAIRLTYLVSTAECPVVQTLFWHRRQSIPLYHKPYSMCQACIINTDIVTSSSRYKNFVVHSPPPPSPCFFSRCFLELWPPSDSFSERRLDKIHDAIAK